MVQIIGKDEYQGKLNFDQVQSTAEPTGLTLEEKKVITDLLINYGLPLTADGKNDFNLLRNKLAAICPPQYLTKGIDPMKFDDGEEGNPDELEDGEKYSKPASEEAIKEAEKVMMQNIERFI